MFPTLGYLLRYLTGWNLRLPVPTFGFFMALAFWAAYIVFTLELRRKLLRGGAGGPGGDVRGASGAVVSGAAPGAAGAMQGGAVPAAPDVRRLMDRLLLWCGLIGFTGALLLAKLEDTYNLFHHPWRWLIRYHGLTYFGGLLFGAVAFFIILRRRGIPLAVAADIGSPGMMLAYAIGRLGCHLAGDGDWGIVARAPKPGWLSWAPDWVWAAHYPHNVLRQGVFIPGCTGDYCAMLPDAVYPTSLYEAVVCFALFVVLWGLRRRLLTPGLLFYIYTLMIGVERFFVEYIRITPRHALWGLALTQAQGISLACIAIGVTGIGYILTRSAKKAYF
jgi:phosphatidylglycerol:prolipoprotein diacylglycerol transferase